MKSLLLLFTIVFSFNSVSTFDNSTYIEDEGVVEMLDIQFVKDCNSEALISNMETYLTNYFDEVTHVSGHYAKESSMYYYTVYGDQNGTKKFEMLEVPKELFDKDAYYKTTKALMLNSCRRGNGYPFWPVCQGYCQTRTNGCLGIICPPAECIW